MKKVTCDVSSSEVYFVMKRLFLFRAHENWNLDQSPDYVTFAKKMQIGGFYYNDGFKPYEVQYKTASFIMDSFT